MNVVNLIGNVCKDIELRTTDSGTVVARTTLAVNGIKKDDTSFPNLVMFNKTAEVMEKYVKKGQKIGIEGSLKTGSYTNKEGVKVYTTDVIVNKLHFVQPKEQQENFEPSYNTEGFQVADESLPF